MAETDLPWVVDPVWLPSRGRPLGEGDVAAAYREAVIPHAALLTPNILEAEALIERPIRTLADARDAAEALGRLGPQAVLLKGGHLRGDDRGIDLLLCDGRLEELRPTRVMQGRFHGTGCALSAAIATRLAFGEAIPVAVASAKAWVNGALQSAFEVGKGALPVNHLFAVADKP